MKECKFLFIFIFSLKQIERIDKKLFYYREEQYLKGTFTLQTKIIQHFLSLRKNNIFFFM